MMTVTMRDLLVDHIDGVPRTFRRKQIAYVNLVKSAVMRGFIAYQGGCAKRPRFTIITDDGRAKLAEALADWADALTLANVRNLDRENFHE